MGLAGAGERRSLPALLFGGFTVLITITKQQLNILGACTKGICELENVFGGNAESWSVEWTRNKQIELISTPLGIYLGWAFTKGLIPQWSMNGADLRHANLRYITLRAADLSCADLSYTDLSCADLSYTDLSYTDLSHANLSGANLSGANLSCADLSCADLSYTDLSYANLTGAKLCICNSQECAALRKILDKAGWKAKSGLLTKDE